MTAKKKAQQKRINAIYRKYHRNIQKVVEESGSSITGVSIQFGDAPPIEVASRKGKDNE